MTLSRTARFLIGALLVAAAAFVWVNFFNQNDLAPQSASGQTPGAISLAGAEPPAPVVGDAATPADGAAVPGEEAVAEGQPDAGAPADGASVAAVQPGEDASPAQAAGQPAAGSPPVVVAGSDQVVSRDLVVDELPFLVLAPPAAAAAGSDAAVDGASRPGATQRATINPFSPVVVQAAAAPQSETVVAEQQPPAETVIEVVSDGAAPAQDGGAIAAAPPEPVRAPAPRTVAPAGALVADLPRALPAGTLPTTPEILRDARSQVAVVEPVAPELGDLAALREPEPETAVEVASVETDAAEAVAAIPDPIGPGRPADQPAQPDQGVSSLPLAVGADPLSRYLRDNDVRFTGTVLGPLSVGVFRSAQYAVPVVLTLGQALPDTDIVLSDLRGYEARFTQGDRTQTLSLDLRR